MEERPQVWIRQEGSSSPLTQGTRAPGAGLGRSPLQGHCSTAGAVHMNIAQRGQFTT